MSITAVRLPRIAQARKPQCRKDWARAWGTAARVVASTPGNAGGTSTKWASGSPAAQNTPPPASSVHMIIEPHWKRLNSGVARPPSTVRPPGSRAMSRPTKKVASSRSCQ